MATIPVTPGGVVFKAIQYVLDDILEVERHLTPRQYQFLQLGFKSGTLLTDYALTDMLVGIYYGGKLSSSQQATALQVGRGWGLKTPLSKTIPTRQPAGYGIKRIGGGPPMSLLGPLAFAGPMLLYATKVLRLDPIGPSRSRVQ